MNSKIAAVIFVLLLNTAAYPQRKNSAAQNPYARVDQLMEAKPDSIKSLPGIAHYINKTFISEYDKSRAIFYWVTENISYAPELMYSFTNNENRSRLVRDVFDNKRGICLGYAVLVDTLCKLSNLQSYVILGSTKQSFLPSVTGHAWNAVKIFDVWHALDATWGSGFLKGDVFIKKRTDHYFLPDPDALILTHLPVDPIWQLLKRPVTLYQFHSKLRSTITTDWNFVDSINVFLTSDAVEKIKSQIRRLAEFGNNSEVTSTYFNYLKSKELEYYNTRMHLALKNYNLGVERFNAYIDFKNHQFTPLRPDEEIARLIPDASSAVEAAFDEYSLIINKINEPDYIEAISSNLRQINELRERVNEEKKFVDKYLSTKKNKRRDLFYTKVYTR